MLKLDTNKLLEQLSDIFRPQEISDVLNAHMKSNIYHIPILDIFSIPSDQITNPIFPGQKQANPSYHFWDPCLFIKLRNYPRTACIFIHHALMHKIERFHSGHVSVPIQ